MSVACPAAELCLMVAWRSPTALRGDAMLHVPPLNNLEWQRESKLEAGGRFAWASMMPSSWIPRAAGLCLCCFKQLRRAGNMLTGFGCMTHAAGSDCMQPKNQPALAEFLCLSCSRVESCQASYSIKMPA